MKALTLGIAFVLMIASSAECTAFRAARPVWPEGREREKNLFVGAHAAFEASDENRAVFRIAASSLYRAFLNGEFLAHGPARGPHGYYRVDEWDLTGLLRPGTNVLAVEVAGYNVCGYYLLDQPSFLQAEVVSGGSLLAATRADGANDADGAKAVEAADGATFRFAILPERVRKVQRYSFQRPFIEVYRLAPGHDDWRTASPDGRRASSGARSESPNAHTTSPNARVARRNLRSAVAVAETPLKALLPRRVPCPDFRKRSPSREVARGTVRSGATVENPWKDRSLTQIGPLLGGFPESELAVVPSLELQAVERTSLTACDRPYTGRSKHELKTNEFAILDFGTNLSGFPGARIACTETTRLYVVFDEILSGGDVDFKRLSCVNAILYELQPGTYEVESFEPYTLRYLKLLVLDGACTVDGVSLRELANPDVFEAHFACPDPRLLTLFDAGRETFAQNAVDLFMDCPSRERAGWLCDSFFMARTAIDLSGDTRVEHNFIENFLLPERFEDHPEGMLPMCYPADHDDGRFIPNWALWFVLQLEEFAARGGDRGIVAALEPRVMRLFEYFERFRNGDGLLESLESWVFVEWSAANGFVQDVNYPSNMLYAGALAAAGRLYDRPGLLAEAETVRIIVREQSFDGEFFVDNAIRKDGALTVTRNRTEVCQYFAFHFNVATPKTHPGLWKVLCDSFGPDRKEQGAFPEIHPANAFIGNVLRMEILSRYGRCRQILDESIGYLSYMAERTGTLWENTSAHASCNHGFASHIVHTLYRDILGIYRIDPGERVVTLRFTDVGLPWCRGSIPLEAGILSLRWQQSADTIEYNVRLPAGYEVRVENGSDRKLVRLP